MIKILLMILLSAHGINAGCESITLVGPRTVRKNSNFKTYVIAEDIKSDDTLIVGLKYKSEINIKKFKGSSSVSEVIDYQISSNPQTSYKLMALFITKNSRGKSICYAKEQKILASTFDNFFNLIQLDKPAYKPGDKVRFRVLTLDRDTKPYNYQTIKVDVVDASGKIFKTFSENKKSELSVYENSFKLCEQPAEGNWRLQVSIDGNSAKTSKTFIVKDIKPPPFQVYIETVPAVAFNDPSDGLNNPAIKLKLYAKYSFDKFVKGIAKITATVYNKNSPNLLFVKKSRQVTIKDGAQIVNFDLRQDLDIKHLTKNVIVKFDVEFVEEGKGQSVTDSKNVEVLHEGRHYIVLKKAEKFNPGFNYKIEAEVLTLDGRPERSTNIPIKMDVTYESRKVPKKLVRQQAFLKDGKANFVIETQTDFESMDGAFEFDGTKLNESIEASSKGFDEKAAIQATLELKRLKIDDEVKVKVQSNGLMNTLRVIVIRQNELVHTESFEDSKDAENFEFSLKITKEMAPESTLIVFYIKENTEEVIYDQFKLELGFHSRNNLTIVPTAQTFKLKQNISLTLNTESNSLVGLLGIDQSVYNLKDFDVTKEEVNSKLSALGKLRSEDYEGDFYMDLYESNVFILQPMQATRRTCKEAELKYINSNEGITRFQGLADEFDDDVTNRESFEDSYHDDMIEKYFPDVWLFDSFEVHKTPSTFIQIAPDTMTTWIVSGFAIHPQHGLAIAEPKSIKVYQEFFIKAEFPKSVKVGEIFKIDVNVYNFLEIDKKVEIIIQPGDFEIQQSIRCNVFQPAKDASKTIEVYSKSGNSTEFYLKAIKNGEAKVIVEAKGQGVQDSIERKVEVEHEGVTEFKNHPMLIDFTNNQWFHDDINIEVPAGVDPDSVKIEASVSGNLLGPAIENIERLTTIPEVGNEAKLKSFALSMYAFKYLKSFNQTTTPQANRALDSMRQGYQNIVRMQTANGGFKLWNDEEDSEGIWLSAYVTQLLGDAREFIEVDDELYTKCLEYFRTKQNRKKFFDDDGKAPKETPKDKTIYTTAFVMIAVGKNKRDYYTFSYMSADAVYPLSVLKLENDFEKAILAYAFSLSEEEDLANEVFNKLAWRFEILIPDQLNAIQIETASYIALAALKLERFEDAKRAVDWLIKQRKQDGGFFSTHDTVLGLEALTAYQMHLGSDISAISFGLNSKTLKIESQTDTKFIELPSNTSGLKILAHGNGLAYVNVFYQYKVKQSQTKGFQLTLIEVKEAEKGLQVKFKIGAVKTNLAVVEVEMPSGFEYLKGWASDQIKKMKVSDDKSKVFLYFDSITATTFKAVLSIEAVKVVGVKNLKPAFIKAYDYYEPDQLNARTFYNVKENTICSVEMMLKSADKSSKPTKYQRTNRNQMNTLYLTPNYISVLSTNENQDPDIYYTAEVSVYATQRGAWDPWKQKFQYNESWKKICDVTIVSENKVITGPWGKCPVVNSDLSNLQVRIRNANNQYRIVDYQVKEVSYQNHEKFIMMTLNSNIIDFNAVEIAQSGFNLENLNCITSSNVGHENEIKTKRLTLRPCGFEKICANEKIDDNIGNPLICNYNGRNYLFGIGIGVNQNVAIYQDIRNTNVAQMLNH